MTVAVAAADGADLLRAVSQYVLILIDVIKMFHNRGREIGSESA